MTDTFLTPSATKLANRNNAVFAAQQRSFSLAPLGGMSTRSGAGVVYSEWVQMPCDQSVLDLSLVITALKDRDTSAIPEGVSDSTAATTSTLTEASSALKAVTHPPNDTGLALTVAVQTCREVSDGIAVDTPRAATGGEFGAQTAPETAYAHCLVLRWARLQIVLDGTKPTCAFFVTGTGVPLGLS